VFLPFRLHASNGSPFPLHVVLHLNEFFHDGVDALQELPAGELVVDKLHLRRLSFPGIARRGHLD